MTTVADPAALAVRARTALANAREVTLRVDGLGTSETSSANIALYDRDGCPTFLCGPGCAVPDAAARRRPAEVCVEARNAFGDRWVVRLRGTLHHGGVDVIDGVAVNIVVLRPGSVHVHCPGEAEPSPVPIEAYRAAAVDPVACSAAAIVTHTNAVHGEQLRETAAHRAGLAPDSIAGAMLSDLDREAVVLHWVDERGAHSTRIRFATPATGPHDLAAVVRDALSR